MRKAQGWQIKVKFKKRYGGAKYILLIDGKDFTEVKGDQEIKGRIDINEDCTLQFDYLIKPDTANAVGTLLSKSSKPYFDLKKTSGRKLKFRLTGYGGPHITAGEGYIIKIN